MIILFWNEIGINIEMISDRIVMNWNPNSFRYRVRIHFAIGSEFISLSGPKSFRYRFRIHFDIGSDLVSRSDEILVSRTKEEFLPLADPITKRERIRSRNHLREVGSESEPIRIRCAYWVTHDQDLAFNLQYTHIFLITHSHFCRLLGSSLQIKLLVCN